MSEARTVTRILPGRRVTDGGGVPVRRTLGGSRLAQLDPFLLVDELKTATQGDIDAGLPSHPHRGIETITYVIGGALKTLDDHANEAVLQAGDLQWVTAASGVIHDEMPVRGTPARAVQFWLNLPSADKMGVPTVRTLRASEIPERPLAGGGSIRVIAGLAKDVTGAIQGGATRPTLLDVTLKKGGGVSVKVPRDKVALIYVLDGQGMFGITGTSTGEMVGRGHLILLSAGDLVKALSGQMGVRFLVLGAVPIGEPIVRYGPIVMCTSSEVEEAVHEFHEGTFVRTAPVVL